MVDQVQMIALIKKVLMKLNPEYATKDAVDLVFGTGLVESQYEYIRQLNNGRARGFWQIEPDTAMDNIENFIKFRPALVMLCTKASGVPKCEWEKPNKKGWDYILESNIAAGIIHCRIKYRRIPKPLPKTLDGMASYWKNHYNTYLGKGKKEDFINKWEKL